MRDRGPYVPALRFRFLTRFYDGVVGLLLKEKPLKKRLIHQAAIGPGHRVLDVGCGTATLTLLAQQQASEAFIVGVDGDLETLALARAKASAGGTRLRLCAALGQALPFAEESFERAVSSLFFHHLARPAKRAVASSVRRVLGPGGELHILDWGKAQDPLMRGMFIFVQLLDGFETTADSVRGRLVDLLREAGFDPVEEKGRFRSLLGTLSTYSAAVGDTKRRDENDSKEESV